MGDFLSGKRFLVTGACGTIGQQLTKQLLESYSPGEVIGIDNNESELFFLEQRLSACGPARFVLADIRDHAKMERIMEDVDIVFHSAAYKHVVLCERSPYEAVQTNIVGVQNIIKAACEKKVSQCIFCSSDKAVNPTSVMGTSKLMGERLMTASNSNLREVGPSFACTRFGNVLGSRGSVIPIFMEQIKRGGPVTLTDPEMTRFIMTIKEAVRLVIDSATLACGGEVFITKMPVIRIMDLAEVMIETLAPKFGHDPEKINIRVIGSKPGEKLYEELMSEEETRRSLELERYFVVMPAFTALYRNIEYEYDQVVSTTVKNPYNSSNETALSKGELKEFLQKDALLEEDVTYKPDERYWPDPDEK